MPLGEASSAGPAAAVAVSTVSGPASAPTLSTFLSTDIEGSTRLWEERPTAMAGALAGHDALLRAAVEGRSGSIFKTTGDGLFAVFHEPTTAVLAALDGQRALRDADWGEIGALRVRMAIHSGIAEVRDGDYFGQALNRSARILGTAHGGQVLVSATAAALARDALPDGVELVDLGSHRLRDLDRPEQIFQVAAPGLRRDFPALRSLSTRRSNLPVALTSFVGREPEIAQLSRLLVDHRLISLVGTGGTGKTRLMLELAERVAGRFPDGTWLAELAPLGDPAAIASEVVRALGIPDDPGRPPLETAATFLADKELLLLLDNAEHLVDGVARVAEQLLAKAPGVRILTTSREALAVPGEAVLQIPSLSCPASPPSGDAGRGDLLEATGTDAVRLFADRAASVDPAFAITAENVANVAEICRRLDGIPLAIELAAARVSSMSPDDIARRLGDRFRLLAGGRRTAVPRQQTLHALVDWSWDLLTDPDRRLLRRLSIFAGTWTAEMAAIVVGDDEERIDEVEMVDRLTRLVDRSLVLVERGMVTRYRMLETIRHYAREKLIAAGEVGPTADRHLAAFLDLAIAAKEPLKGPAMPDWLDRLDAESDNIGTALEWAIEASPWDAVRLASALMTYWSVRVASPAVEERIVAAIEIARRRALGAPDGAHPPPSADDLALAASLLGDAARIWGMSGRAPAAAGWADDATAIAQSSGDRRAIVVAGAGTGVISVFSGRPLAYTALFATVVDLAEQVGDWWTAALAGAFGGAGTFALDPVLGEAMLRRGEAAAARSGSPQIIASAALARGRVLGRIGETASALERFDVSIARFSELGDERLVLAARSDRAHALRRGGRLDEARDAYRETIAGWVRLGNDGAIANQLENLAFIDIDRGELDRAGRLLGAAEAAREAAVAPMPPDEQGDYDGFVSRLRAGGDIAGAWAAGRRMPIADAVELAVAR
ncbi:MAG TPA: AAA family ATPase [Candidatus Limnocylindrales bacterium]